MRIGILCTGWEELFVRRTSNSTRVVEELLDDSYAITGSVNAIITRMRNVIFFI